MGDLRTKEELYVAFAEVGKALSNGKRIEILDVLSQGERSVEVLSERIGTSITTTSAHLQIMRRCGLVATRREGTHIFYSLSGPDVISFLESFRTMAKSHNERIQPALERYLGRVEDITLSQGELAKEIGSGKFVILDVRPPEEYLSGHIPGAISIPLEQLSEEVEAIVATVARIDGNSMERIGTSEEVQVVVYCRGPYCSFAISALEVLKSHHLAAVRLSDGFTQWRLAGREVEVGAGIS
ncbi:MAG: metalloregulator ArsR/SmtB family transcription factor [Actinomycetota bacterium]|nr:metalloregulator ArsR/SmtB family transcription factor [Actinomycetota bacterium]